MPPPAPRRLPATKPSPSTRSAHQPGNGSANGDVAFALALADREDRKNGNHAASIHRMLPQSAEAEIALLSATLILPRQVIDLCRDEGVTEATFHLPANATIARAIRNLDDAKQAVDAVTLTQRLRDTKELDQIGGPSYLMDVSGNMPTAANTRQHIAILREKETLRDIIASLTEIVESCYDEQDAAAAVEALETTASRIAKNFAGNKTEITDMKTLAMDSIQRSQERRENKKDAGLPTGIPDLEEATGGLSGFTVIAGKTTEGKTSAGMSFAAHIAIRENRPVGFISLEMSKAELTDRLIAMESPCNLFDYINGRFSDDEIPRITEAVKKIANAPIYIDDEHGIGIAKLVAKARAMHRKYKIEALFIDYFQLLSEERGAVRSREADSITVMLTKASRILKQLNKELDIPVIVFAQVDPATGRPKWCTAIEDDANNYFALKHGEDESHIEIRKQRSGPKDVDIPVYFDRKHVRFLPEEMRPAPEAKPGKKKK